MIRLKRLYLTSLIVLVAAVTHGQVNKMTLRGTWIPISVNDPSGEPVDSELYNGILTFTRDDRLIIKNIGKDSEDIYNLRYEPGNVLYIRGLGKVKVTYLTGNRLKILFGVDEIVSYRPLEEVDEESPLEKLLLSDTWHFTWNNTSFKVIFTDSLPAKDRIRDGFSEVRACYVEERSAERHRVDPAMWKVENYRGHRILSIQKFRGENIFRVLYINSFSDNNINAYTWYKAEKHILNFTAEPEIEYKAMNNIVNLLTSKVWSITKASLNKDPASQTYSDYYIPVDTALTIEEEDLEKRSIKYHFDPSGEYAVINGDHVIKKGRWSLVQKGTVIELNSDDNPAYYEIPDHPLRIIKINDSELVIEKIEEIHEGKNSFRKLKSVQFYN